MKVESIRLKKNGKFTKNTKILDSLQDIIVDVILALVQLETYIKEKMVVLVYV